MVTRARVRTDIPSQSRYDKTIDVLKPAISPAKLGRSDALAALSLLDVQARAIKGKASVPSFDALLSNEQQLSPIYGGRTAGWFF